MKNYVISVFISVKNRLIKDCLTHTFPVYQPWSFASITSCCQQLLESDYFWRVDFQFFSKIQFILLAYFLSVTDIGWMNSLFLLDDKFKEAFCVLGTLDLLSSLFLPLCVVVCFSGQLLCFDILLFCCFDLSQHGFLQFCYLLCIFPLGFKHDLH